MTGSPASLNPFTHPITSSITLIELIEERGQIIREIDRLNARYLWGLYTKVPWCCIMYFDAQDGQCYGEFIALRTWSA